MIPFKKITAAVLAPVMAFALTACTAAAASIPTDPIETESQPVVAVQYMDTIPESWEPLADQSAETEFLLRLTTDRLYRLFSDGSEIIPSLAATLPVDVTAEYPGTYNVPGDALRGYAFRIDLNPAACFEDGTPITADDYLTSMESQIDRFTGLANVRGMLSWAEKPAETVVSLAEAGYGSVAEAKAAGATRFYLDIETFWGLGEGWQSVEDRTRYRDFAMPAGLNEMFVSAAYLYDTYLADDAAYSYLQSELVGISENMEKLTFQDVGIVKTGEHQLTLILDTPTTAEALALKLADFYLTTGAGKSYGPYRVLSADAELIELERNPHWWGDSAEFSADILRCRTAE